MFAESSFIFSVVTLSICIRQSMTSSSLASEMERSDYSDASDLASFVEPSAQALHADIHSFLNPEWRDVLHFGLSMTINATGLLNLVSSVSETVLHFGLFIELMPFHQAMLSDWYVLTLVQSEKLAFFQQMLITLMQIMMSQNIQLSFDMDISVWNQFFVHLFG